MRDRRLHQQHRVTLRELTRVAYDAIPNHEEPHMQTAAFFGHHIGLSAGDPALLDEPLATEDGAEGLTAVLPRTPEGLEGMIR